MMEIKLPQTIVVIFTIVLGFSIVGGLVLVPPSLINNGQDNGTNNGNNEPSFLFEGSIQEQNQILYNLKFNGTIAWKHLVQQVNIGFRFPGTVEINLTRIYIVNELKKLDWQIEFHNFTHLGGIHVSNILAFPKNIDKNSVTLFGAHYDTRKNADRDPTWITNQSQHVTGANDGASGIAILLELARIYQNSSNIALLFIDAEDQGNINGWGYTDGSQEFVKHHVLTQYFPAGNKSIKAFILFDMIGDWDLNIHKEQRSDVNLINGIWNSASILNYLTYFTEKPLFLYDDHLSFVNAGIPAVDLVDFDYKDDNGWNLHHTSRDNLNYVHEKSLWIVGQTIEHWFNSL